MMVDVIDLFAGGGGSSEGLRQAGCKIRVAANHDRIAVATHQLNHPGTEHRLANLSEIDWRTFPTTTIMWGSPSCRWHARTGGRKKVPAKVELRRDDPGSIDRATAFAIIEAAEVHRQQAVIVENVPEFTDWVLFPWWLDGMRALGYDMQTMIIDAADLGAAQHRKRWFGVFTQDINVDLTLPTVPPVYASDILDPDPGRPVTRRLYVHDQIESIGDRDVPHLVTYRKHAKARRADRHRLATITAGGNHHAVATITSNGPRHRLVTNRECARAQGFGDEYRFVGTARQVKRQIGNAVPVPVARFLGERVIAGIQAAASSTDSARSTDPRPGRTCAATNPTCLSVPCRTP